MMHNATTRVSAHRRLGAGLAGGGFTLTELLVVIAVFAILLAAGIPAFSSILRSSEESLAQNKLRLGLSAARDSAIASGQDSAALFTFTPGGRTAIVTMVKVGEFYDDVAGTSNEKVKRDVFAPVSEIEPAQLPAGWMVRGYAPAETLGNAATGAAGPLIHLGWYNQSRNAAYEGDKGAWVFPETGYFKQDLSAGEGVKRQSFMVRFEGGSGRWKPSNTVPAIAIVPQENNDVRPSPGANELWKRPDRQEDLRAWAKRVINLANVDLDEKAEYIGNESCDTVLAGPVSMFALYDEAQMAGAVGLRGVNRQTGSIFGPSDDSSQAESPAVDDRLFTSEATSGNLGARIDQWIEGRLEIPGAPADARFVQSTARVYTLDPLSGTPLEVSR